MEIRTAIPLEPVAPRAEDAPERKLTVAPEKPARKPTLRKHAWTALGLPFLALSLALALAVSGHLASPFRPALLTAVIAVAVFAVSLSFVVFQLAPYRSLVPGAAQRHIVAGAGVLALSLAPLVGLAFGAPTTARIAVTVLPLVAYASLVLMRVAQREAAPDEILARRVSDEAVRRRCLELVGPLRARQAELEELERRDTGVASGPMHEWFQELLPPPSRDDPLELLVALAAAAVERKDSFAYSLAVKRALATLKLIRDMPVAKAAGETDHSVRGALISDAERILRRIGQAALAERTTSVFGDRYVDACLQLVRDAIRNRRQGTGDVVDVWDGAVEIAAALAERGFRHAPIEVMIVARIAAERGLQEIEDWHDKHRLTAYSIGIEGVGRRAIAEGYANLLYRSLDTLCWIGCAAVRTNDTTIGADCLQGLAQLGREARAKGLECFWSRCLLTPADHADERLEWIATWLQRIPAEQRTRWQHPISQAFARLRGHSCQFELKGDDGELQLVLREDPNSPHTETLNDNGRVRTIDYSDEKMLKEYDLH